MHRLIFLVPNTQTASSIVDELTRAGISRHQLHVVAKHGVPMEDLPDAHWPEQTSDFFPALEKGLALGGVTGLVAGLVAMAFPPAGFVLGGGAVLATTLAGAGLGGVLSSIVGSDMPDSHLKRYQDAIEAGEILLMVDVVPPTREDDINRMIKEHHPEADIRGVEPALPPF